MTSLFSRILSPLAVLVLVLSACGSDDAETVAADTETTTTNAPATTVATTTTAATVVDDAMEDDAMADSAADDSMDDTDAADESSTADDDPIETDGESGIGNTELEEMLPFFGVTDTEAVAECIAGEAEKDETTVTDILNSEAIMVAVVRCAPEVVRDSFGADFGEIDSSSIAATPEQIECSFDSLLEYIADLDMSTAGDVLSGDAPEEVINQISDECGISAADADFLLNDA